MAFNKGGSDEIKGGLPSASDLDITATDGEHPLVPMSPTTTYGLLPPFYKSTPHVMPRRDAINQLFNSMEELIDVAYATDDLSLEELEAVRQHVIDAIRRSHKTP